MPDILYHMTAACAGLSSFTAASLINHKNQLSLWNPFLLLSLFRLDPKKVGSCASHSPGSQISGASDTKVFADDPSEMSCSVCDGHRRPASPDADQEM